MTDDQKLTLPKPIINTSPTTTLGSVSVSQDVKENMNESGISAEEAIKKLEEAVQKGVFEGIDIKQNE